MYLFIHYLVRPGWSMRRTFLQLSARILFKNLFHMEGYIKVCFISFWSFKNSLMEWTNIKQFSSVVPTGGKYKKETKKPKKYGININISQIVILKIHMSAALKSVFTSWSVFTATAWGVHTSAYADAECFSPFDLWEFSFTEQVHTRAEQQLLQHRKHGAEYPHSCSRTVTSADQNNDKSKYIK